MLCRYMLILSLLPLSTMAALPATSFNQEPGLGLNPSQQRLKQQMQQQQQHQQQTLRDDRTKQSQAIQRQIRQQQAQARERIRQASP